MAIINHKSSQTVILGTFDEASNDRIARGRRKLLFVTKSISQRWCNRTCARNTGIAAKYAMVNLLFFLLVASNSAQKLLHITLHHYFNIKFSELRNILFLRITISDLFWVGTLRLGGLLFSQKIDFLTSSTEKRKSVEPCLCPP